MAFWDLTNGRDYAAIHGNFGEPPEWFNHIPPSGRPGSEPDISGLTADEQEAITIWVNHVDRMRPTPRPDATKTGTVFSGSADSATHDYNAWFDDEPYQTWRFVNMMHRWAQWRWVCADILALSKATLSASAATDQIGSAPVDGSAGVTNTT